MTNWQHAAPQLALLLWVRLKAEYSIKNHQSRPGQVQVLAAWCCCKLSQSNTAVKHTRGVPSLLHRLVLQRS